MSGKLLKRDCLKMNNFKSSQIRWIMKKVTLILVSIISFFEVRSQGIESFNAITAGYLKQIISTLVPL